MRHLPIGDPLEHCLDDTFRFRARVKRLGGQEKRKTPEFALPENAAQRLVVEHTRQDCPDAARLSLIHRLIGMTKEVCRRDGKSRGNQPAGLTARILEASRRKRIGGQCNEPAERFRQRAYPPTAASLAACSSVRIASTISSNPSPLITFSILYKVRLIRWSVTRPCGKL